MWQKIDSYLVIAEMNNGSIITDNPIEPNDQYEIKSLNDGYVKALHINGKNIFKIFPRMELLSGNWWVKNGNLKSDN
jgi:hypothetical protein